MVFELPGQRLRKEPIDAGEKRGKGLPGAGRGRNERILSGMNGGPRLGLHIGRGTEGRLEPLGNEGMEAGQRHPVMLGCRPR